VADGRVAHFAKYRETTVTSCSTFAEGKVKMALNHAMSLSFDFDDAEGHLIEVYWPTGIPST